MYYVYLEHDSMLVGFTAVASLVFNASVLVMVSVLSSRTLFLDLSYPLGLVLITVLTMLANNALSLRSQALLVMMIIWAMRLAFHLMFYQFWRPPSRRAHLQDRYRALWESLPRRVSYVIAQASVMTLMGIVPAYTNRIPDRVGTVLFPFAEIEYCSLATFATGMVLVTLADGARMVRVHKQVKAGVRHVRSRSGLYGAALYPHYVGELLVWLGMSLMPLAQAIHTLEPAWHIAVIFLPLAHLLATVTFFAGIWSSPVATSSEPTPKYLDDPRFRFYYARTPALLLGCKARSGFTLDFRTRLGWSPLIYAMLLPRHTSRTAQRANIQPMARNQRTAWSGRAALVLLPLLMALAMVVGMSSASPAGAASISSLNLLLPHGATHSLSASGGCFAWESSNPEVVAFAPAAAARSAPATGLDCVDEIVLTAHALPDGERASVWVFASDRATGTVLRCEVFVDTIASLAILTTSRTMYRGDAEVIEAQAFDAQGNVFNSLSGLRFAWSVSAPKVLAMAHAADYGMAEAEHDRGLHSFQVVLRGEATGTATVALRLSGEDSASVEPASADISVLEPLHLEPYTPVGLVPGTQLQYKLFTRGATSWASNATASASAPLVGIPMPDASYSWSSSDAKVLHVDPATGLATALRPGVATVTVSAADLELNSVHALVRVALPDYLTLTAQPIRTSPRSLAMPAPWTLVHEARYEVAVHVHDSDDRELLATANMHFEVELPRELVQPRNTSANGAAVWAMTKSASGPGSATARLVRLSRPLSLASHLASALAAVDLTARAVDGSAEFVVGPPLALLPSAVHLPPGQTFAFAASGGSGVFHFSTASASGHPPFSLLDAATGIIEAHARAGAGKLYVSDTSDPFNGVAANVTVAEPAALGFPDQLVEVQVGSALEVSVQVLDARGEAFTACSILPFRFRITDPGIFRLDTSSAGTPGALVALGTSWTFAFAGGPAPWVFEPSTHKVSLLAPGQPSGAIRIEPVSASAGYAYRVTCLQHVDATLVFAVTNAPSASNPVPARETVDVDFVCAPPHTLDVSVGERELGDECSSVRAPVGTSSVASSYTLQANQDVRLAVRVLAENGAVFDNATSLAVTWAATPASAALDAGNGVAMLSVGEQATSLELRVAVSGYAPEVLSAARTRTLGAVARSRWSSRARLEHVVELEVRPAPVVDPPAVVLFSAADNKDSVVVRHGSGHVSFSLAETSGAEPVAITPLGHGVPGVSLVPLAIGTTTLVASDTCLVGGAPLAIPVTVADLASVELKLPSMVHYGSEVEAMITVYAPGHKAFPAPQLAFMEVRLVIDDEAVVTAVTLSPSDLSRYKIHGRELGTARLTATVTTASGVQLSSGAHHISVFPPLRLEPASIELVCGASAQVLVLGGPSAHVEHVHKIRDSGVAQVANPMTGEVVGLDVGTTVLTVAATGYETAAQASMVYASATVPVTVRKLAGVRIAVPNAVVLAGSRIALAVEGSRGESPHTFAILAAGRKPSFRWEVTSGAGVVGLASQHEAKATAVSANGDLSIMAWALSPGTATVSVTYEADVACGGETSVVSYTDSVVLTVLPVLSLVVPPPCEPLLVIHPLGSACIATNRDGLRSSSLEFAVVSAPPAELRPPTLARIRKVGEDADEVEEDASEPRMIPEHGGSGVAGHAELVVDGSGCVHASAKMGTGFVAVRDTSDGEFVLVGVRVAAIDHIAIVRTDEDVESGEASAGGDAALPMGGVRRYEIRVLDDLGRQFSVPAAKLEFAVSVSHPGRVAVTVADDGSLSVRGASQGAALVSVALASNSEVVGHVRVVVGEAVTPASPRVALGGRIQFALSPAFVAGVAADGPVSTATAQWSSGDASVVAVDPVTGAARAVGLGTTTVHVVLGHERTYTHVWVVEPVRAEVGSEAGGAELMTNVGVTADGLRREYLFPVTVWGGAKGGAEWPLALGERSGLDHKLPLVCNVEPRGWALASASGRGCVVTPLSPAVTDLLLPSTLRELEVVAKVGEVSGSRKVAYAPAFSVFPSAGVSLSQSSPSAEVEILGPGSEMAVSVAGASDKVAVATTSNSSSVVVLQVVLTGTAPRSSPWSDVELVLVSTVTGQEMRLRVLYDPAGTGTAARRTSRGSGRIDVPSNSAGVSVDATHAQRATRTAPPPTPTPEAGGLAAAGRDDAWDVPRNHKVAAHGGSGFSWWYVWLAMVAVVAAAVAARVCALPSMQPVGAPAPDTRKIPESAHVAGVTRTPAGSATFDMVAAGLTPTRPGAGARTGPAANTTPTRPMMSSRTQTRSRGLVVSPRLR
ncbi:uncharacterized protein AMSG_11617 [Thecamonas trahens ATCC 50062]|uniref:Uncharacterized protein n=1 Tax=Thecamonas trahens ATCC 50062 TaxID=461836 RepID=A0A0L0DH62_THETB|nr:hypothetical protein AMSG_11617 [Thecamonas trahens ATCC 50062]KNC50643.1 hypothetical protein AMSG_11617 [Thecamonas trahens ATCC 50062]|eukprot:XP_013762596.1 hypothetical protein AMSG_11617 [Thecamonas trahens ATCC 50062]